ncbi:ABC transporter substrate-binding protein [Nocardia sp. NBC_01377]|uniref:ABC transporter substrate-binding protein n=1 Tax=Nocardia sp. NBC_01377 TaxID=2903595 RepID=UPI0032549C61
MYSTRKRRVAIAVAAMSVACTAAMTACSSSQDSSAPAVVDKSALGTPNKATGDPVTVGFIYNGKTQLGDTTDEVLGAQSAIGYANDYLGGINGHRIEFKACASGLAPSGTTDCANQMVQAKAAAVVVGALNNLDAAIDTLRPADIPIFMYGGTTQKSLSTPGVYGFYNGMSAFGISAVQAQKAGAKKAAVIVAAVPVAQGSAEGVGKLVYGNAGVPLEVVPIPLGTADMMPQVTATGNDVGQYLVLGSDAFCLSSLKAIRTLAPKAAITIPDRCITVGTGGSIPNGYEGMEVATSGDYTPEAPDSKIFTAALAEYGDGGKFGPTTGYGWQPTLAFIQALNATKPAELTPSSILAAVQSAPALPLPLGGGVTYQCDGKQNPLSPFMCGNDGVVATAAKDGTLSDFRKVTLQPSLFKLPGS